MESTTSENNSGKTSNSNNYKSKSNSNKKKKNKKRFLSNAKGFAKKGIYGRGAYIEEEQFTYFVNILSTLENNSEIIEEKCDMANNVFEQTIDNEINLSSNQVVSKVIEALIGYTTAEHFERFITKFSENLRPLCSNSYASHVLEKLIKISLLRFSKKDDDDNDNKDGDDNDNKDKDKDDNDEDLPPKKKSKNSLHLFEKEYNCSNKFKSKHRKVCGDFIEKMGKYLLNNLEDFIWDSYANPIIRTTLKALIGSDKEREMNSNSGIDLTPLHSVPVEWHNIVKEFAKRLEVWPQFSELPYDTLPSLLLSELCYSLKEIDENFMTDFGKKILYKCFLKKSDDVEDNEEDKTSFDKISPVFVNCSAMRLLENLLNIKNTKLYILLNKFLFMGRIKLILNTDGTKYALKALIENADSMTTFESIFKEIDITESLQKRYTSVVYALSCGCLRFKMKQSEFITSLKNALHLNKIKNEPNSNILFICLLTLKPYEEIQSDENFPVNDINYYGSLTIQNILKFDKPINLVNCILNTKQTQLVQIFTTRETSFIFDAFMESKFIGEKSREKLLKHLNGYYIDLAITRFGSWVIDKIFKTKYDTQKMKIAKELTDKSNQLKSTTFGRIIFNKYNLSTYRLSPEQWIAGLNRTEKAQKLFKEILN